MVRSGTEIIHGGFEANSQLLHCSLNKTFLLLCVWQYCHCYHVNKGLGNIYTSLSCYGNRRVYVESGLNNLRRLTLFDCALRSFVEFYSHLRSMEIESVSLCVF